MKSNLLHHLQMTTPIIVAPMAGGPTTLPLITESLAAGALGSLGAAYLTPSLMREFILDLQKKTHKPFAVNLFARARKNSIAEEQIKKSLSATRKFRHELNIVDPELKPPFEENFDQQFDVILETRPAVLSFIFGSIGKSQIQACRKNNILCLGTATSLEEALVLEQDGVDAIIAQGDEAGGHHGFFDADHPPSSLKIRDLLAQLKNKISVPVIAAGGIMNGRHISEMLKLGAVAVQMGTAFLACREAGTNAPYLQKLLAQDSPTTKLTKAFSGRWARGIENRFMTELDPSSILPFPAQNAFTRDIRAASLKQSKSDFMSLWAGTGFKDIRPQSTRELITLLMKELNEK